MKLSLEGKKLILENGAWIHVEALAVVNLFGQTHRSHVHRIKLNYEKLPLEIRAVSIHDGKISFDYSPQGAYECALDEFKLALTELFKMPRTADKPRQLQGRGCGSKWKPTKPPKES